MLLKLRRLSWVSHTDCLRTCDFAKRYCSTTAWTTIVTYHQSSTFLLSRAPVYQESGLQLLYPTDTSTSLAHSGLLDRGNGKEVEGGWGKGERMLNAEGRRKNYKGT